ncbi:MAG: FkbM family methyltransferase [Acidiferrobacterales bacterium]|nr:FkbM family methyltransferase [Acidiferrobacterales bacterium]
MDAKKYLHELCRLQPELFFLEIGAMDGKSFDLLHDFIRQYQWRGILVEPLTDLFQELKQTYADCSGLTFENVAITNTEENRFIFRIPPASIKKAGLPSWAKGISSLFSDRNAIGGKNGLLNGNELPEKFYAKLRQHIVEEEVECVSLSSLLEKHKVEKIDVLQIDTEGYDYQIFKQFDFSTYSPWFMKIEVGNLIPEEFQSITEILEQNHYQHRQEGLDILAWKPLPKSP